MNSSTDNFEKTAALDAQVRRFADETGASLAEYALLCVLIALPVSFAIPPLANAISVIFAQLAAAF